MTLNTGVADDRLGQYYRRIAAIADRLGKSLDFEKVMSALQRIHDGELDRLVLRPAGFPVWLEIEVGGKSEDELLAEIVANGMFASNYAKDIMSKAAWQPGERESIQFGRVPVKELGFSQPPTTTELWSRIEELGHWLCEPGDGPALRVAFKGQSRATVYWTALKQITDSDSGPYVFTLECRGAGTAWLNGIWSSPDDRWNLDCVVVFRLRN